MSDSGKPPIPRITVPIIPKATPPLYPDTGPVSIPKPTAVPKASPPPIPKAPPPKIAKPAPPPLPAEGPGPGPQARPVLAKAKKLTQWDVIFRVIIVIFILVSIAFAWWSYSERLVPLQQQSRELASANSTLSAEVDTMDRKWSKNDAEFIRARYKEVYSALFADEAALREWLKRLESRAVPLALDVQVDFGKGTPQLTNDDKLAIIPAAVTLQVHPTPNGKDSPYQRLLRLGQQLASEGKRSDLAELTVTGGTSSITNAVLVFNLWAGEEKNPK